MVSEKAEKIRSKGGWTVTPETFNTIFESGLSYYPIEVLLESGKKVRCFFDVHNKCYVGFSYFSKINFMNSKPCAFRLRKVLKVDRKKLKHYN